MILGRYLVFAWVLGPLGSGRLLQSGALRRPRKRPYLEQLSLKKDAKRVRKRHIRIKSLPTGSLPRPIRPMRLQ